MSKADLSYHDWIDYVFDHAVPFYRAGLVSRRRTRTGGARGRTQAIEYLTRLFENPEPLADQFADSQIGQGLYYLIDNGAGAHCRVPDRRLGADRGARGLHRGDAALVRAIVPAALRARAVASG